MTEKQINEKLIIVLEEKIQLLEEQKVTSQKIIDIQNEQLILSGVSQQRELLNALADEFNDSTHTYVGQPLIEKILFEFIPERKSV